MELSDKVDNTFENLKLLGLEKLPANYVESCFSPIVQVRVRVSVRARTGMSKCIGVPVSLFEDTTGTSDTSALHCHTKAAEA